MPIVASDKSCLTGEPAPLYKEHDEPAKPGPWVPVQGDLVTVLLALTQRPEVTLVKGGVAERSRSLYVARALNENGLYIGWSGFHTIGARVIGTDSDVVIADRYEVLVGGDGEYEWHDVYGPFERAKLNGLAPVIGGHFFDHGDRKPLYVAQAIAPGSGKHEGVVCGGVSDGSHAKFCYDENMFQAIAYRVLVKSASNLDAAKVIVGTFTTTNFWKDVGKGAQYSTSVNFDPHLPVVPKVVLGIAELDMRGQEGNGIVRFYSSPTNITKDHFICGFKTWSQTTLYNASTHWLAICEPTWQTGVLDTQKTVGKDVRIKSVERRVTFSKPFTVPPMVFVCLGKFDIGGVWNWRTYATNVDYTGFTIAMANCGEDSQGRLWSMNVNWIAIPGEEILQRKNAWIGSFSTTEKAGVRAGKGWTGHVDFGFKFKRIPKIFLGLNHFNMAHDRNIRLITTTFNVTPTGMDWKFSTWDDSVLMSASANFLAVDADNF